MAFHLDKKEDIDILNRNIDFNFDKTVFEDLNQFDFNVLKIQSIFNKINFDFRKRMNQKI